jgi:hypothetical protein
MPVPRESAGRAATGMELSEPNNQPQGRGQLERPMKTEYNDNTLTVIDEDGGIWWPSEEAQEEIEASENPELAAMLICEYQPMRGRWAQ